MLSISKPFKGAGRADYYLNLAREDYYLDGMEPPGFWLGEAAALLGLSGTVQGDDFRNVLAGFSPNRDTRLVHNAGSPNRRSGWDLTWSVPKSVSVVWSQATPEVRAEIERAARESVRQAIAYLASVGVVSRRGTDGVIHEQARLLFAAFEHSTSRAQDPQLHLHTVLINIGVRPDGSTGTLEPRSLYRHQLAAGALFRAELAARLEQSLGLRARREGRCFEIIGVDVGLMAVFSTRRAQITARLAELGLSSPAAAERAALETRTVKVTRSREELFPLWQATGRAHHWSTKELGWLLHAPFPPRHVEREMHEAAPAALLALTTSDSHFARRQLVQALAEAAQGRGLDADCVLQLHRQLLASPAVVSLGPVSAEPCWTTPEMLALEKRVLALADQMRAVERALPMPSEVILKSSSISPRLSDEQVAALCHVTGAEHGLRIVSGMAGTGKSTLFRVAHEVWLSQGKQVVGACLAGKAALELASATQISTQTIHRLLGDLARGRRHLDADTVLLVDEAAMVGTRQMHVIFEHCQRAGATLVLCGDARQLQAIEAGGVFQELACRHGAAALCTIQRQREEWARQAVTAFADGRAAEALQEFAGRGLLIVSDDATEVMTCLLADWKAQGAPASSSTVILASRTADVLALNRLAQTERFRSGQLAGPGVEMGPELVFAGDRIVFTQNCRTLGVWNGQTATVAGTDADCITARLDSGHAVSFAPSLYPHAQLGYALTTHKAQGMTAERALVYIDTAAETRELAYVQASRARTQCSLYAVTENIEGLAAAMARSRPKIMATSLLPAAQESPLLELQLVG